MAFLCIDSMFVEGFHFQEWSPSIRPKDKGQADSPQFPDKLGLGRPRAQSKTLSNNPATASALSQPRPPPTPQQTVPSGPCHLGNVRSFQPIHLQLKPCHGLERKSEIGDGDRS